MKTQQTAISATFVVLVLVASAAGILAVFYFAGSSNGIRIFTVTDNTFNASTSTLNFSLNNPFPMQQAVSSVTVVSPTTSHQMSCNANFAPLKSNAVTSESCVVSGGTFVKGETVNYFVYFANGQEWSGTVNAQ